MAMVVDKKQAEITALCQTYHVKELYLFGSALNPSSCQKSDIDLAVVFSRNGVGGSFNQYFGFKNDMEELLKRAVDLVCLPSVRNSIFRQELNETKRLIYAAQSSQAI